MAALHRNRRLSYTALRDGTGLTDGNLASHVKRLEEAGYMKSGRTLNGVSFHVVYQITPEGSQAFVTYADVLRAMLDEAASGSVEPDEPPRGPATDQTGGASGSRSGN